jgi:sugar fermentation stimulation protein A
MKFPELTPGVFIKRDNRFVAGVRLDDGKASSAFVPTTGRLTGVLRPGCRIWLEPASDPKRKTPFTLILAELENGGLCSINAIFANALFDEALQSGHLVAFPYSQIEHEVSFGRSRLDFRLSNGPQACWVEVKSVTYVQDGLGMFPDAPTGRGRKHLGELAKLVDRGDKASVVFIAQRADAQRFEPFEAIDPEFAQTLRQVKAHGVAVHAYRCQVSLEGVEISAEIPVKL